MSTDIADNLHKLGSSLRVRFKKARDTSTAYRVRYDESLKIETLALLKSGIPIENLAEFLEIKIETIANWERRIVLSNSLPNNKIAIQVIDNDTNSVIKTSTDIGNKVCKISIGKHVKISLPQNNIDINFIKTILEASNVI